MQSDRRHRLETDLQYDRRHYIQSTEQYDRRHYIQSTEQYDRKHYIQSTEQLYLVPESDIQVEIREAISKQYVPIDTHNVPISEHYIAFQTTFRSLTLTVPFCAFGP